MKMYNVEAEWHMLLKKGGHRIKAKVLDPDIAIYINGMVVYPPDGDKYPEWTVCTPKVGNARIIEFANKSVLWQEIKEACIDAVKENIHNNRLDPNVDSSAYDNLTKDEFNKKFMDDLDKLGF